MTNPSPKSQGQEKNQTKYIHKHITFANFTRDGENICILQIYESGEEPSSK